MYKKNLMLLVTAFITAFISIPAGAQNLSFLRESPIAWLDDNDKRKVLETNARQLFNLQIETVN